MDDSLASAGSLVSLALTTGLPTLCSTITNCVILYAHVPLYTCYTYRWMATVRVWTFQSGPSLLIAMWELGYCPDSWTQPNLALTTPPSK